jgi:hypothetical protein
MPTPRFGLPFIAQGQAQKEVTHNDALVMLDALVDLYILDRDLSAPPGSPADGDAYIVAASPTGAWAGQAGNIAYCLDGSWRFHVPVKGLVAYIADEPTVLVFTASGWADLVSVLAFQNLSKLGILTSADTTNRLAVKSDAVLLSHDDVTPGSGDLRVSLNKGAAAKDACFVLQDGFSTRALFGLLGDDNLTLKVSPDGSTFNTGISVRKEDGHVGLAGFSADTTNDLGVKAANILFDRRTDSIRAVFNKAAAADTASFMFQSGYSGRAEIGLAGSDNLEVKVSADGSAWTGALTVERTSGRVGVRGATSPVAPLHVGDASSGTVSPLLYTSDVLVVSAQDTAPGLNLISAAPAASNRGVFKATRSRGSLTSPTAVATGDQTFSLLGAAFDGTVQRATAGVTFVVDGTVTDNVQAPQAVIFETGTASRSERLRINSSGNVGIGTASPAERLTVAGHIAPAADNAYSIGTASLRASVVYAATGTINTSDLREKCDLADSELGLAFIRRLRPRSYRWRVGAVEEQRAPAPAAAAGGGAADGADPGGALPPDRLTYVARPGRRRHHGLIAQEVRAALDELGIADFAGYVLADPADPDSRQGLRYDQFIAPLVKAVQELDERLRRLEDSRPM